MTSCNEFTWPPVFTGSCLLFKMSFSSRWSPRAFYRFSPRAQSCSEYTMVWQDTSECLFKHLMRVKRIVRIRWWRSIKKIWFSLQLFITFVLGFPIRIRSTFRHMGKHLVDSPHPLPFRAVLRSPQRNGGEPLRQATKREITSLFGHCCGHCCGHWCGSPSWLLKRSSKLTLCLECLCHGFFCFVFFGYFLVDKCI